MELNLYGVRVRAAEYEKIKRIADVLVRETSSSVSIKKARKACVYIAARALAEAKYVG